MLNIRVNNKLLKVFGILSLTCIVFYANTIRNLYSEDDYRVTSDYFRKNAAVEKGFGGLREIFTSRYTNTQVEDLQSVYGYRPMARATFAVEWGLWGQNPHMGHFINILLYCLAACLLFYILSKTVFRGKEVLYPLLSTLLFVAHPIHTEVVASLKNREEQLCFIFGLLFIGIIWRFFTTKNILLILLAVIALICSIISKETGIIYLFLAPLFIFFFHPQAKRALLVKEKISLIAILLSFMAVYWIFIKIDPIAAAPLFFGLIIWFNKRNYSALWALAMFGFYVILTSFLLPNALLEETKAGHYFWANPINSDITLNQRLGFMLNIFLFNVKLLFYPHPLSFYYGYNTVPVSGVFSATALFGLAIIVGLLYFAYKQYKKNKVITFIIVLFFAALAPFSNIMPVPGIVADRFLYTPSLSFCIALALLLINIKTWMGAKNNRWVYITAGIIGLIYLGKVFNRNQDWYSYFDLYSRDARMQSNSAKANSMFATLLIDNIPREKDKLKKRELLRTAIKHYERSLKVYPTYAESLNALGVIYFRSGQYERALPYYLKNIKYNPDYTPVYVNTATCYHLMGNTPEAKKYYTIALKLDSLSVDVYLNFADLYLKENKPDSALYIYSIAKKRKVNSKEIDYEINKITTAK